AYVVRCEPVRVTITAYENCTTDIPVVVRRAAAQVLAREAADDDAAAADARDKQVQFVNPLTRILTPFPTVLPCSTLMPVRWEIDGVWMCAGPKGPTLCAAPTQLEPMTSPYHQSSSFTHASTGMIVTKEQLINRDRAMAFTRHREAILTQLVGRRIEGASGGQLGSLLSHQEFEHITTTVRKSVLGFLLPTWIHDFGESFMFFMGIATLISLATSIIAALFRFFRHLATYGCQGGRGLGQALLAMLGVFMMPRDMVKAWVQE
ncbi:MAG: DUF4231 domain-containing protein, partial [Silicimonas sp.]|nr:DUF4231 domain-containing protein [Silicimonas sp.]